MKRVSLTAIWPSGKHPNNSYVGTNVNKQWGFGDGDRILQAVYGLPSVGVSLYQGLGGGAVWTFPNHTYRWEDNLTFTRGTHTFKAGGLYQKYGIDTVYGDVGSVSSSFSGHSTASANYNTQVGNFSGGQPFADFLLGAMSGIGLEENPQVSTRPQECVADVRYG